MDRARPKAACLWIGLLLLACSGTAAAEGPGGAASATGHATADSLQPSDTTAWSRRGGGAAKIEYTLPKSGHVHVRVFDAAGHEIAHPVNEWQTAGSHVAMFAFGPSTKKQVFRYRVECGTRKRSGKIEIEP